MNEKKSELSGKPNSQNEKKPNGGAAATIDLTLPHARLQLARTIADNIDRWAAERYNDGHRSHLGASLIGRECSRYLWYVFRWVYNKEHTGRQQRLFQRGHREEEQMLALLEGIGATVNPLDGDKQHRISDCGGHFGGSIDNIVTLPESYGVGDVVFINEFKTNGTGASFNKVVSEGVQAAKNEHFCQMSIYGYKKGIEYGLYMNVNKNDDSLHVEVVKLDFALAQRLIAKAERIVLSPLPPQKLSESAVFTDCKYCDMHNVCHKGQNYEKNCRSCIQAQPIADGLWHCKKHGMTIPKEFIPIGCNDWTPAQ